MKVRVMLTARQRTSGDESLLIGQYTRDEEIFLPGIDPQAIGLPHISIAEDGIPTIEMEAVVLDPKALKVYGWVEEPDQPADQMLGMRIKPLPRHLRRRA